MNNLIRTIRAQTGLSQQELADKLDVTFATINRWENAKAAPNKLAQTKLYDLLLQKIQRKAEQVPVSDERRNNSGQLVS